MSRSAQIGQVGSRLGQKHHRKHWAGPSVPTGPTFLRKKERKSSTYAARAGDLKVGTAGPVGPPCPGCGSPSVLPGRVYCRPTCKARHQWQRGRERPLPLLALGEPLENEL